VEVTAGSGILNRVRFRLGDPAKSWAPMRSTKGVTRLDSFGNEPAQVDDRLIELLRARINSSDNSGEAVQA